MTIHETLQFAVRNSSQNKYENICGFFIRIFLNVNNFNVSFGHPGIISLYVDKPYHGYHYFIHSFRKHSHTLARQQAHQWNSRGKIGMKQKKNKIKPVKIRKIRKCFAFK